MELEKLSLLNFKNYTEAELNFSSSVNAFTGDNGAGKTNLLDAIHYLCLCKSYFNPADVQQIKSDTEFFMLQGSFEKTDRSELISCSMKRGQKKQFKRNKKDYQRLADHIGLFPVVMISPYDISIIIEGSEERRRFIDNSISQTDNQYLDELISYNKNLANRNALLKQIADTGRYDPQLLEIFDEQLSLSGDKIFRKRKEFVDVFIPLFNAHYQYLSENAEQVELIYESQLKDENFRELLKRSTERDRVLERTTNGIHKDDLQFSIHGMSMKKFGSQGQQKSFLIALKLAQYSYLVRQKGYKPLLLLDDIFDKLDDKRIRKLMEMVSHEDFGQIFITDTSSLRVGKIFEDIRVKVKIFAVDHGNVAEVN
ncbi:DNA replication and repair protein RecF [Pedobacter sp. HMF7647]|uniref:DNA replication and repair protein RecF n=1 Tax=Hufsiella arboris TaxID=2695275 RepID=A0A7K1YCH5_9SPHI|nr:DNA replication and repair protein RecF [Hufsiella arboris]MXV51799.1 DNA replication and repair protein RecF [Hufsiella arboris]